MRRLAMASLASSLLFAVAASPELVGSERVLRHEVVVDAPVETVWWAFVDPGGMRTWMVPWARVDLRVGGTIETSYDPEAEPGDPNNIVQRILSYEPERMLSARLEKAPASSPHREAMEGTWGVIRLEPIGANRTRVVGTMLGWREGAASDAAYEFFQGANEMLYRRLQGQFAPDGLSPDEVLEELSRFVGDSWRADAAGDSSEAQRSGWVMAHAVDGKSIVGRGLVGDDAASNSLIWLDSRDATVRIHAVHRAYQVDGEIVGDGESLIWRTQAVDTDGAVVSRSEMRTTFLDAGTFRLRYAVLGEDGKETMAHEAIFRRVKRTG